ncbi:efflux RND transporter permease subunit [Neptunomonas antarctica]|uniref:Multidrug efflux pump subunit AcrB n=1 Tax=Neptunomonas antarctica TaxID=619304 RepID=A0A1N7NI21_9GAMM|nr:efflux RND transporter permease subunit [Neptunomonas antarctica]SIS97994.1 Multidrug efflux pump subunit AcrB [Neptunomonas antarctica]
MHMLTNWFIRNPVAANLLMGLILILGYLSVSDMRIEGFPKIPPDSVGISVYYPGANAAQVDEAISQKIEKALEGLPGAKRIISFSSESSAYVRVKMDNGYSLERLLEDVNTRVNSIATLPQLADRPVITREAFNFPALIVQVYGNVDTDVLQRIGKDVKAELLARPEISKISSWGEEVAEVSIEISPEKLESYGLSYETVAHKINQSSLIYRTGKLSTSSGTIVLRADRQAYHWQDFSNIPILDLSDGSQVLLGDIATIKDTFVETEGQVRYKGTSAIGMEVIIDRKGNLLDVSKVVHEVVSELREQTLENVSIDIWADQSNYISDRLALLRSNAFQGLLIVFVILSLFLNFKLAFWVAMGIPISIAGTLWLMGWERFDYSLNDITTFGMIVVLGILVDDAIVVGESVFTERGRIKDPIKGTEKGVEKVATATIFGVLTSVAAFYPMLLIDNPLGKVLAGFSGVVIIALLFSLLESKFILPAHLAGINLESKQQNHIVARLWQRIRQAVDNALNYVNHQWYRPALEKALVHRYATLILFLSLAVLGVGLATTGTVRTTFFPDVPGSIITVTMEFDPQSPYSITQRNAAFVEAMAKEVNQEVMREHGISRPPIEKIMTAINNKQRVEIYAELTPEKLRTIGTLDLIKRWREKVGRLEAVDVIHFSGSDSTGGGFALTLFAKHEDVLQSGVDAVSKALRSIEGVYDVRDDLKGSEPEIFARLKPEAGRWGVTIEQLAAYVSDQYGGMEVQRFQRDGEEIKVQLRNPKEWRNSIDDLMNGRIMTPQGEWLPISAVAELESRYVSGSIWRRNGERAAIIYANLDKSKVSPSEVIKTLKQEKLIQLQQAYPDLEIKPAGELEESGEITGGLKNALILALILIYVLLAVPLKSYSQPFVIMIVIPFGIAGAIAGHFIADIPLSVLSFFGMLALTGIVVNDSLVMLTTYNQYLEEGMPRHLALVESGSSRFRAILLTTVTTVSGLMPLLTETSEQAQYLIPAAVSLAYGEMFATAITLFAVPIVALIFVDIKEAFTGRSSVDLMN